MHDLDPHGRDDHLGDPSLPNGPDPIDDTRTLPTPDQVLATLAKAIEVGTVSTPAEIREWVEDRGYELTVAGGEPDRQLPEVPAHEVEALADRLEFDGHLNRVARARTLLQMLAIDGWHLAPIDSDVEASVIEDRPISEDPWQQQEARRHALGHAVDLAKADQITPEQVVDFADLFDTYLSGRDCTLVLLPEVLKEAADALAAHQLDRPGATLVMAEALAAVIAGKATERF